ncbi:hypothetical protein [Hymenobacter glacieicola]|uniref:Uncharacterized protein n=1 Tax=Hymenobacter glacieicola TaxID=1562124 RepID=A0ABQ1WYZ5_9BACT|nr:hypothetical protein [Hymenobacter glacieicola]GGG51693.1 hypothetical protein GCM10011378_29880 [Hymenobacter glacieicola]
MVFRADAQAPTRRYQEVGELRALRLHDGRYFVRRTLVAARNGRC